MAKVKINLSESRPVIVESTDWPVVAKANWFSGQHECQANEVAGIKVRQHADGRAIVYGSRDRGPGGMPISYNGTNAGYRVSATGVTVPDYTGIERAIRRVAGVLDLNHLGQECVEDLDPEEVV